ncbi:MAG TPA: hypothetical protein VKA65_04545 [Acidimicrobiales bacterium]|nr:hypothetical protein [Acidimicrobiales bacterium]
MSDRHVWGMIDAQPIVFPARVHESSVAMLRYRVPGEALRAVVPEEVFPFAADDDGFVRVTLLLADYRSGDWGPSAYAGLTVPVVPGIAGVPRVPGGDVPSAAAIQLCRGVTNAAFTDEVMYWALGLSGALGELDVTYRPDHVAVRVGSGGDDELFVRLPRPPAADAGPVIQADVYTSAGKAPRRVRYELEAPVVPLAPESIVIETGTGPLADTVRALGLTRSPDTCNWGERLGMSIHRPHQLDLSPPGAAAPADARPTMPLPARQDQRATSYGPWP